MRDTIRKERPERIPLGDKNIMTVRGLNDRDEYVYRWINDEGDRIVDCYNAGYEFVDKNGLIVGDATVETRASNVGILSKNVGNGVTAYLMKQLREQWVADRKARVDDKTDLSEAGLKQPNKDAGFYGSATVESKK